MSTKHTPGPWRAYVTEWGDQSEETGWIVGANGEWVSEYAGCGSHDAAWNEADFTLALAAPELLEALQNLVGDWPEGEGMSLGERVRQAKSAIAKATGA
jgi:hypothetical protein